MQQIKSKKMENKLKKEIKKNISRTNEKSPIGHY